VATHPHVVGRFAAGPLHGTALALYFALLPFVVIAKWRLTPHLAHGALVRVLLIALAFFWLLFLTQLIRDVIRLRRGLHIGAGGIAWLAGLMVATLTLLAPTVTLTAPANPDRPVASATAWTVAPADATASTTTPPIKDTRASQAPHPSRHTPSGFGSLSALSLALMAKRRSDDLRQQQFDLDDAQIDDTIELLRNTNQTLVAQLRYVIGDRLDGVMTLSSDLRYAALTHSEDPVLVCVLCDDDDVLISFAREGGSLRVPAHWSNEDIMAATFALHNGGRTLCAPFEHELLRALATRKSHATMVLYLGAARDLDLELSACAVIIQPVVLDEQLRAAAQNLVAPEKVENRRLDVTSDPNGLERDEIRVEVLRSEPRIVGLTKPFTATLRRRCVEMVAYLALHRHEPVTGDRLRTRVLVHADVDASTRTLANTASAVRRSLGVDERGPRLHPVTSSGLYVTHGVTSDLEIFHSLVARARQLPLEEAAAFTHRALALVRGEPLASALRGFEWFLVEGLSARLMRDGEWASLALHQHALNIHDVELAYWSIAQGLLIDPESDALTDALARVPRLRQFGGDRSGAAQNQAVGAGGAVAVSRPLDRLGDQILQQR
jgi:hypothetical protein